MKKTSIFATGAAAMMLSFGAQAVEINGAFSVSGFGWTPTPGPGIVGATGVTFGSSSGYEFIYSVGTAVGDFVGRFSEAILAPSGGNIQNFTFNPFVGPINGFWTIADLGAEVFSFRLDTLTINQQDGNFLILEGTGYLSHPDYDETYGTWKFTGQQDGGSFSWSASNAFRPVPEPGTLALLGLGMLAMGLGRRRA